MKSLVELFSDVDDFCQEFEPQQHQFLLETGQKHRRRKRSLCLSEVMTILIHFHQSSYRTFKAYYCEHVCQHLEGEFPGLVSYQRFVEYMPDTLFALVIYLQTACLGKCTGISFVDSTSLKVCHNRRIHQNRVFSGLASRGKSSLGWFYGFKLHLVCSERGDLLNIVLTPGNVDDRKPVPDMAKVLFGKLFGDRGYISKPLFTTLWETFDVQLITRLRKNMKNRLIPLEDQVLLRKRAIIETIIDQLKNISQIEHSRHRSPVNFFVNVFCGLIAYCHQPKKPSLRFSSSLLLQA